MNVKNLTPFLFGATVTSRRPPQAEMTVVVRGAFVLAPGVALVAAGTPVNGRPDMIAQGTLGAETFRDGDDTRVGEALKPNDFADFKPKTDLLVQGTCYTPGAKPMTECPVAFRVGDFEKQLRVVGRRVWSDGLGGAVASDPIPFTKMPVDYAHAFGGPGFAKNPSGKGLGDELPNIESPKGLVRSRKDRPDPAGLGPISPEWPDRKNKRGTNYGDAWKKTRAPYYSDDFDWTFFQCAPADQQREGYLRGDEEIRFHNLHPSIPVLAAKLPGIRVRAFVKDTSLRFREVPMSLDTLFAVPDEEKLYLTWRGLDAVSADDLADVTTMLLASEPLADKPLPLAHYKDLLEVFEKDPLEFEKYKPKDLPDAAEELAKANEKLAKLTAASEALKQGDMNPLLDLGDPSVGGEVKKQLAQGTEAMAKYPPPAPDGEKGAVPSLGDMLKASAEVKPSPLPAKPSPALPADGQAFMKGFLQKLAEAKSLAAAKGITLPEEMDQALSVNDGAPDPLRGPAPQTPGQMLNDLMAASEAEKEKPPPGPGVDLSERDFNGMDLRGADLRRSILTRTNFSGARLDGALFDGAQLDRTILSEASLDHASFEGATLREALFLRAKAAGARFRGATLESVIFTEADLSGASFEGARGKMLVLQGAKLPKINARKARLEQAMFIEADVTQADFSFAALPRCLFLKAIGKKATFEGAVLEKTSFIDSDFAQGVFIEAQGSVVAFLRTTLWEADLRHVTFLNSHFTESDATRGRFFAANLREGRFYRTVLKDADMSQANLFFADLCKASLSGTKLTGSNLFGAKFLQASGAGADFTGANLKRSTLEKA